VVVAGNQAVYGEEKTQPTVHGATGLLNSTMDLDGMMKVGRTFGDVSGGQCEEDGRENGPRQRRFSEEVLQGDRRGCAGIWGRITWMSFLKSAKLSVNTENKS
jgi:hypothetical protein